MTNYVRVYDILEYATELENEEKIPYIQIIRGIMALHPTKQTCLSEYIHNKFSFIMTDNASDQ